MSHRKWKRKVPKARSVRHGFCSMVLDGLNARMDVIKSKRTMTMTMREFCESPDFARPYLDPNGIDELYTDVGWAIVDAAEGHRPKLDDVRSLAIFGCTPDQMPCKGKPYRNVVLGLGRGAGKTSRLLAVKCVHAAWTTDLSTISPDDEAVCLLIGPKMKHAKQAFRFVLGVINRSPVLKAAIARDERGRMMVSKERISIKRPDGRIVRIEIAAASRGGDMARGYTVIFAGMEEACFFRSEDSAAVNDRAIYDAITGASRGVRQVVWIVSTPWIEGVGLMEEFIARESGVHEHALVVARVPSRWLNPHVDPSGEVEAARRAMPGGDIDVDREFYAIPMAKGSRSFFDATMVAKCLTLLCPDWIPSDRTAGADLGFVKDAAALSIVFKYTDESYGVPCLTEKAPEKGIPLIPSVTCGDFAIVMRGYDVRRVWADHVYKEAFREHLLAHGVTLAHNPAGDEAKLARFSLLRDVISKERIRLGSLPPATRESLRAQLLSVTLVPSTGGKYKVHIPRISIASVVDGTGTSFRHADAVAALVEALAGIGATSVTEAEKAAMNPIAAPSRITMSRASPLGRPRRL